MVPRLMWRAAFALASGGAAERRLSILIFHRVLPQPDPLFPGEPFAARFEALIRHLRSRFTVLPLSEAATRLRDGTLPGRALAITFDDGYADNLTVAAPVLQRYGVPATVFVATGYLDGGWMFNDLVIEALRSTSSSELDLTSADLGRHRLATVEDRRAAIQTVLRSIKYRPLRERQRLADVVMQLARVRRPESPMLTSTALRRLPAFGLDIGAHTVNHPILARLAADEALQEIATGKRDLERILGREVSLFAYPNGKPHEDYTAEHVRMVRDAGFRAAVTTATGAAGPASDVLQLPRFTPWSSQRLKFDLLMLRNLRHGPELRVA